MVDAYPLNWPVGYPRTKSYRRKTARFDTSFAVARDTLRAEIRKFGGNNVVISTNVPLKRDGFPYANYGRIDDPGVAVYFSYQGNQVVFACDKWDMIEDNLQAIRKTVDAMRGLERWGVSDMLNRAFAGFKALPEETIAGSWYNILGCSETASVDQIKSAYRKLSKVLHPDAGGSCDAFDRLAKAFKQGLEMRS